MKFLYRAPLEWLKPGVMVQLVTRPADAALHPIKVGSIGKIAVVCRHREDDTVHWFKVDYPTKKSALHMAFHAVNGMVQPVDRNILFEHQRTYKVVVYSPEGEAIHVDEIRVTPDGVMVDRGAELRNTIRESVWCNEKTFGRPDKDSAK